MQPHARSVCPAATTGVPCVPHAFAPVVRNGNSFTDARVRHTGEMGACPLHKRACPLHKRSHRAAPQTFCLSLRLWPLQVTQRRPLSSCSLQWQRLPLEWAVDITEIELMDPISCPTTWPVLLNIRGETTNCARPFSDFKSASAPPSQPVTRNPFLPSRAPLIAFRLRLAPLDLHLKSSTCSEPAPFAAADGAMSTPVVTLVSRAVALG